MAFSVTMYLDLGENCDSCKQKGGPMLVISASEGRGRRAERNLIFVHPPCLERGITKAKTKLLLSVSPAVNNQTKDGDK